MRTFAERLIGKTIKSIENGAAGYSIVISFSDGTAITVNTEVTALLKEAHASQVGSVTITKEQVTMHLSGDGFVAIATDRERFFNVVELFIYRDDEGFVVEN